MIREAHTGCWGYLAYDTGGIPGTPLIHGSRYGYLQVHRRDLVIHYLVKSLTSRLARVALHMTKFSVKLSVDSAKSRIIVAADRGIPNSALNTSEYR